MNILLLVIALIIAEIHYKTFVNNYKVRMKEARELRGMCWAYGSDLVLGALL